MGKKGEGLDRGRKDREDGTTIFSKETDGQKPVTSDNAACRGEEKIKEQLRQKAAIIWGTKTQSCMEGTFAKGPREVADKKGGRGEDCPGAIRGNSSGRNVLLLPGRKARTVGMV